MPPINLLILQEEFILFQLHLEEALLRADHQNWCIINQGSPPAIVMGISGKKELLIDEEKIKETPIPIIRRFSGGGTVVVDEETIFVTFILNREAISISLQPEAIMKWSFAFYQDVFSHPHFALRENDFVFHEKKFGGNAQYLRKERLLHHTSFLWDFHQAKMDYLRLPPKIPAYRKERSHQEFLCRLKDFMFSKESVLKGVENALASYFNVHYLTQEDVLPLLKKDYRKTTHLIF